jgi:surface glycoprotein (TIGR04207 family)
MKLKKLTAIFLTAIMVISLFPVTVSATETFTTADALTVLRAAAGLTTLTAAQKTRFNIVGEPTTAHALLILQVAAGIRNPDGSLVPVVNRRGNTSGNLINSGIAAIQGEWIFYNNGNELYKINVDGSGRMKLADDNAFYINVVGDWVYYNGWDGESNRLYRVRTNGTGRTALNNVSSWLVNVIGDWIYYMDSSDRTVYRMKTDGTGRTKLIDNCEVFVIDGDWIYYTLNEFNDFNFYKMKTDGSGKQTFEERWITPNYVDNGLLYVRGPGRFHINSLETQNFTSRRVLFTDTPFNANVHNNWIYLSIEVPSEDKRDDTLNLPSKGFYRMRNDGSRLTKLSDDLAIYITIVGDWVYYINQDDQKLYRIKTDGTGRQEVR